MITLLQRMGNPLTGEGPTYKPQYAPRPCDFCEMNHGHKSWCIIFDLPIAPDKHFDECLSEVEADLDIQEVLNHTVVSPEVAQQCRAELLNAAKSGYSAWRI